MSKQSLLHGGSLLKPPSLLKQGRHSLGIRNGGLDFVKAAVGVFRAWRLPAERRLFSFAVARQIGEHYSNNSKTWVVTTR